MILFINDSLDLEYVVSTVTINLDLLLIIRVDFDLDRDASSEPHDQVDLAEVSDVKVNECFIVEQIGELLRSIEEPELID